MPIARSSASFLVLELHSALSLPHICSFANLSTTVEWTLLFPGASFLGDYGSGHGLVYDSAQEMETHEWLVPPPRWHRHGPCYGLSTVALAWCPLPISITASAKAAPAAYRS